MTSQKFIPALGHRWLTPLYDPLLKWGMRENAIKSQFIERANIRFGQRVLDLGCGTGTLTLMIQRAHPDARVFGIDVDPEILARARQKATRAHSQVVFDQGVAFQLPYRDRSFDRVLSSLVIHHLTDENKRRAILEAYRILKPGGEIHIFDFGEPHNALARLIAAGMRHSERVAGNVDGLLPQYLRDAGFDQVEEGSRVMTWMGTLTMYSGLKKGS
jgi:ubiquinone/menaquinone biosynthesis C-methylase UbiE